MLAVSAVSLFVRAVAFAQPVLIVTDTVVGPFDTTLTDQLSGNPVPLATAQITVRGATLVCNGRHAVASVLLERGEANTPGIITHSPGARTDYSNGAGTDIVTGLDLIVTSNITIEGPDGTLVASAFDLSGKGFAGSLGDGAGGSAIIGPIGGAGGGHGGRGARSGDSVGGASYGELARPRAFGSGGGAAGSHAGGAGGGALRLVVGGTLSVHGAIRADGLQGEATGGSGAGGSVLIEAANVSGAGTISASGADGAAGWGGGAGGRVAVYSTTSSFSGTSKTFGGASLYSIQRGGAGTVYLKPATSSLPDIIVGAGGDGTLLAAATTISGLDAARSVAPRSGANVTFTDLVSISTPLSVLEGSAAYFDVLTDLPGDIRVDGVSRLVVRSLHQINGAVRIGGTSIFHPAQGLTTIAGDLLLTGPANLLVLPTAQPCLLRVAGAVTIDARSTVFGNGLGYAAGFGPGAGTSGGASGSGAGYGGRGGAGSLAIGGGTYGSRSNPIDLGSGGGNNNFFPGGAGGAALRLEATGTITVNGQISCSGGSAPNGAGTGSAGGSGGSIILRTPRLAGTGTILAEGGGAGVPGGAGGGGRIAIYSCDRALPLANIRSPRGLGGVQPAADGTVYFGSGAISVTSDPVDTSVASGLEAVLSVDATGTGLSYQWRRRDNTGEFQPITDSARVSGTSTNTLVITGADCSDAGRYDCLITDACGSYPTIAARLTVEATADLDRSGTVDGDDTITFFGAWDSGNGLADVTDDGLVDADDVILFLVRWDAGC